MQTPLGPRQDGLSLPSRRRTSKLSVLCLLLLSLFNLVLSMGCSPKGGGEAPDPPKPRVILISLDTFRADALGVNRGPETPSDAERRIGCREGARGIQEFKGSSPWIGPLEHLNAQDDLSSEIGFDRLQ